MNKFVIAALSFTAGAIAGFAVAQFITIEKSEGSRVTADEIKTENKAKDLVTKIREDIPEEADPAEEEFPSDDDPSKLVSTGPAHIARPGQKGVNYSKVNKIIKENGYTDSEDIKEVINDPDNEETYEEMVEREEIERSEAMSEYRKRNKGKIVPIEKEEWDTDFPQVDYDKKDLYYFTVDDVLTDENGNHVDEDEYIGAKPRQFGWMNNDEERIYIRNHPKETDFQVWKEKCSSIDWWA